MFVIPFPKHLGLDFVDSGVVAGNVKAGGLTGSAAAAGGGGHGGGYFYSSQTSSNANLRNESFDSATLRATGTFSNKGMYLKLFFFLS